MLVRANDLQKLPMGALGAARDGDGCLSRPGLCLGIKNQNPKEGDRRVLNLPIQFCDMRKTGRDGQLEGDLTRRLAQTTQAHPRYCEPQRRH